ncbi:MAG: LuxR C-terminal-related transcriptional regulator [Bacteroidales bacterium]
MLLTKLHIPPAGNNIVHRTELFEKLNTGLDRKLILVSAPAGYGKTTLVSDWIARYNIHAAWLSLDNGDNDPAVFLSYVVTGIQSVHNDFGQGIIQLINSPNPPSPESIASMIINELLGSGENILLVIDDFHLIKNNEVLKLVAFLLDHIPPKLHMVMLTRSDPALSLSRIRSQHQLVELRSSDLGFSATEIHVLFNKKLRIDMNPEDAGSLAMKTEGWVAGLQLTALSMKGREDITGFVRDLKGDNRYIMDYLIEEVLRIQTDELKEFLLKTSILEQLSAPLCNAILKRSDSQVMLETLEKNNMFIIPLDEDRVWYRYHHLFAELLKQKLRAESMVSVDELHITASEWFYNNSLPLLALDHALVTGNAEKGVSILGDIAETLWKNGQHATLMKYGEMLPGELIMKNPDLSLYYAWILIIAGKNQSAEPFLNCAETIIRERINDKNSSGERRLLNKKLLGKIHVAFGCLYSKTEFPEKTFFYCREAMKNLSDDDSFWNSWAWYSIGWAEEVSGNIKGCTRAFEKALYHGKKAGSSFLISTNGYNLSYMEQRMGLYTSSYRKCRDLLAEMKADNPTMVSKLDPNIGQLYMCMAEVDCMRVNLDDAYENITIAYNMSKNFSNNSARVWACLTYALILHGRGDNQGILSLLEEIEDIIKHKIISPSAIANYIDMKGKLLVDSGQYEEAETYFREKGFIAGKAVSHVEDRGFFSYARLLIARGNYDEAGKILSDLQSIARSANWTETLVSVKIVFAILNWQRGEKSEAVACLLESLALATPEEILMPFIYYHASIKDILAAVYKLPPSSKQGISNGVMNRLGLAIEKRERLIKSSGDSVLSGRELEVLKLIANDLTNLEIAGKLFVSVQTVKTHVKNILLKLDVDSRSRAVKRAREMGII